MCGEMAEKSEGREAEFAQTSISSHSSSHAGAIVTEGGAIRSGIRAIDGDGGACDVCGAILGEPKCEVSHIAWVNPG